MLTFISCAKTMASRCSLDVPEMTVPHFEAEAVRNVLEMSQMPVAELEKILRVNGNRRVYGGCLQTYFAERFYCR